MNGGKNKKYSFWRCQQFVIFYKINFMPYLEVQQYIIVYENKKETATTAAQ